MRPATGFIAASAATAAAVLAALLLLSPGPSQVAAPVSEAAWFDRAAAETAAEYRPGQRLLWLAGLAIQLGVVGALALGRPSWLAAAPARLGSRPVLGVAAVAALVWTAGVAAAMPTSFAAHRRAVEFGRSIQSDGAWLSDQALAISISALLAALLAGLVAIAWRRLPRGWPVAAAVLLVAGASLYTVAAPRVVAPLFNDFEPLGDPALAAEVERLAERADVEVGEVLVVDASRRGTGLNAYVDGLGETKRVVLYDNLVEQAPHEEVRAIVAHELAHVEADDVRRGLLFLGLVAIPAMLAVAFAGRGLAERRGIADRSAGAVPGYVLAVLVASTMIGLGANVLSREVEAAADERAIELTEEPQTLACMQVRLTRDNLSEPDPPALVRALLRTHPTPLERVGMAVALGEEHGEPLSPRRCRR